MQHHLDLRAKIIIMVSVMASLFLVALDQTIISTALSKIVEEFNAYESLSWIVTAYLLTTTVTVPIAGKLSDLYGRRLILLIGVAVFVAGSLFSAMSGDINMLIFARAFQGIGGGIITANAFTIVGDLFAARERGKWQGLIGAVFGLSSIIGPLLGGFLTDEHNILGLTTDWRWTFYINVPIGIAAFALISYFCPPLKHSNKPRIDYIGAALLTVALALLVLAVDNTEMVFKVVMDSFGWSLTTLRIVLFGIVAATTAAFIVVEKKAEEPILPLRFFKNANFTKIMGIATLFGAAFLGAILYLTQFNQQVFGATATESGLMLLPMIAGLMFSSIAGGQIISRTGRYKIFMQIGIVIATAMVFMLSTLTPESSYATEAIMMVFLGLGLGIVMPVMNLAVQNEFEQRDLGVATSSSQLFRGLGSTVGVAILGGMLTSGIITSLGPDISNDPYLQTLSKSPVAIKIGDLSDSSTMLRLNMPDTKLVIEKSFNESIKDLPTAAKQQAAKQFNKQQSEFASKITHSFSNSLSRIFMTSSVLMLVAAVLVFSLKERELKAAKPDETPGI